MMAGSSLRVDNLTINGLQTSIRSAALTCVSSTARDRGTLAFDGDSELPEKPKRTHIPVLGKITDLIAMGKS